ncbi:MAG: CaiB/BaiF CoA-transferase family protein [bacterium]
MTGPPADAGSSGGSPGGGPLAGVRVLELAGIGPGPFAAMLLADLGADVICVERPPSSTSAVGRGEVTTGAAADPVRRGRRSVVINLKQPAGRQIVLDLVERSDVLIEGFRPGVMERLGLGPADCRAINPRLVYGRMTGWGQDGPLAATAGHDITYLALTGVLDGARRQSHRPVPPMNLLGDLGAGATYLVIGVLSALLEAGRSGQGQVVDAAIVDGAASLATFVLGLRAQGRWSAPAGGNLLDTGAPYYDTYACADGRELAVGALESAFYGELVRRSGIPVTEAVDAAHREDPAYWPAAKQQWASHFATRPRDEWLERFAGSDACVAPVLTFAEAAADRHLRARDSYVERAGVVQGAPAPRLSRTPAAVHRPPAAPGQHTDEVLGGLGRSVEHIAELRRAGVVG